MTSFCVAGVPVLRLRLQREEDDGLRLRHDPRGVDDDPRGDEAGPDLWKNFRNKDNGNRCND